MVMIKLYIYAAALVAGIALGLYVVNQHKTIAQKNKLIAEQQYVIDETAKAMKKAAEAVEKSNQTSAKYQKEIEDGNNEKEILRRDLATNVKFVRIKASCPSLPDNATTTSGTTERACELDDSAQSDYVNLLAGIEKNRLMYDRLKADNQMIRELRGGK